MILYKIKDWNNIYENNRTREMKTMSWIPLPVKLDGDGYTLLMEKKNGVAIFGAFVAILEVASRCNPRGTLIRTAGIPHDPATLSRLSRIHPAVIEEMLQICTRECKWIETEELQQTAEKPQEGAGFPQEGAAKVRSREQNRTEQNTITIQDRGAGFEKAFNEFREMRKKARKVMTDRAEELIIAELDKLAVGNIEKQIAILEQSIKRGWLDVFELKSDKGQNNGAAGRNGSNQCSCFENDYSNVK